jgi:hypothetical protein
MRHPLLPELVIAIYLYSPPLITPQAQKHQLIYRIFSIVIYLNSPGGPFNNECYDNHNYYEL